jgi:hypothetical protein
MLAFSEDHDNLRSRMISLGYGGYRGDDKQAIDALIAVHLTLEYYKLNPSALSTVLDLLSKHGRESLATVPDWDEDSWIDFDYGNVKQGDFVRVKPDAYDSESGSRHNGLVGIMTFMRGRVCTVDYIGLATGNSHKHPMEKLDSLKGVYNRRPPQNTRST